MSEPIKTNAEILANQQAFQASYARAQAFFEPIDGVEGVGFGQKQTGGQFQDTIALVVFVREKKPAAALPPEQQIPPVFEGYPTDVRVVEPAGFDACDNDTAYDPIQGGIQLATARHPVTGEYRPGTLGCIVRKRNNTSRENVYLLTACHALFTDLSRAGDYIYHPAAPASMPGQVNGKALGPIQKDPLFGDVAFTPPSGSPGKYFADAGIARLDIDSKCCGSTCSSDEIKYAATIIDLQLNGTNAIKGVRSVVNDVSIIGQKVFKVGRATGRTVGRVRLINASLKIHSKPNNPQSPEITVHNLIEIEFDAPSHPGGLNCKGRARFTEKGDSGAAVVDEQGQVISLHAQGGNPGQPNELYSYSCHIQPILDNLNIDIMTTSSAHATNLVADDSGLDPTTVNPGSVGQVTGGTAFAAQVTDSAASLPDVVPANADELQHLYALRDQLRATEQGRALHDAFVHVRSEIGYLVRNARPVKVVWHRHKGPAFFAHTLQHLRGGTAHMPQVVDGVTLDTLLTRMHAVLHTHGSRPLQQALDAHGTLVLALVLGGASAHDYLAQLQQSQAT